jgi:predicted secreted protein
MFVKEAINPIQVKVGQAFRIRFWEDRTRGSRWQPAYDPDLFTLQSDDYQRTRNIRVDDVGMRYFEFVASKEGRHEITFELRYGWKFAAEDRSFYVVEVTA